MGPEQIVQLADPSSVEALQKLPDLADLLLLRSWARGYAHAV